MCISTRGRNDLMLIVDTNVYLYYMMTAIRATARAPQHATWRELVWPDLLRSVPPAPLLPRCVRCGVSSCGRGPQQQAGYGEVVSRPSVAAHRRGL